MKKNIKNLAIKKINLILRYLLNPNYKTKMETEILETPDIIKSLIKTHILENDYIGINLPLNIKKIILVASGSSYHCATIGASLLREIAKCEAQSVYASEFILSDTKIYDKETLFIFISQSGETFDTKTALKMVNEISTNTLSITNNQNSTIYEETNYKILTNADKEYAIASTKAMTAQLFCLFLITLKIMYAKKFNYSNELESLKNIPQIINSIISRQKEIKNIAKNIVTYNNITILGFKSFYPLAKECALKIKETSYINTSAYPQGEFMHGHVAVLNKKSTVITVLTNECENYCIQILKKIKKDYNPKIIVITTSENKEINEITNNIFKVECKTDIELMFASLLIYQILSLEIAQKLHKDIDKPTGLSKVLTE